MPSANRKSEIAQEWAKTLVNAGYVPMSRVDAERFLGECLDRLVTSLSDASSAGEVAAEVGAELVRAEISSPDALDQTLRLLAVELPTLLADPIPGAAKPLVTMLSAVAAGYSAELRATTLHQQEAIQEAVLRAKDSADARFRAVFTSSALGIAVADLDGTLQDANTAMGRIFRRGADDLRGQNIFQLTDEDWVDELRKCEESLVAGELEQFQVKTRFRTPDSVEVWTQISASLVRDSDGVPAYQVLLYEDITERHMLQEQLHRQATHDPLTGLANRTLLQSRMDAALRPITPGRRVGLCYFDLDGFKAINDSLGHFLGDQLLQAVAQRLHLLAKEEGALAARMGGDEFIVLISDAKGTKQVIDLVERMLAEITRPALVGDYELNVSASAGVVECAVESTDSGQLLRDADITLYRAKSEGKAQWVLFDSEVSRTSRRRFHLSTEMPAALERNEFFVEYEPVVVLETGQLCTIEAVVRWDHPEFGELDASEFLSLARETGLITKLGDWMLGQACRHARHLRDRLGEEAPVVALNLTNRQFQDPEAVASVRRIMHETGVNPGQLRLVIQESGLFDSSGDPVDHVEIFQEMGVHLGVAQFGGEFTKLARLRGLPVHAVKIAASYLSPANQGPDPIDEHVVSSLVTAASLLGLYVVAEGVETAEQFEWLRGLGVYAALGPYMGGLASALEVEQMISEGSFQVPRATG